MKAVTLIHNGCPLVDTATIITTTSTTTTSTTTTTTTEGLLVRAVRLTVKKRKPTVQ